MFPLLPLFGLCRIVLINYRYDVLKSQSRTGQKPQRHRPVRGYISIQVAANLRDNLVTARVNIDREGHQKCRGDDKRDGDQNGQQPHTHSENLHESRNTIYYNILCAASSGNAATHMIYCQQHK